MTNFSPDNCLDLGVEEVIEQRRVMEVLTSSVKRRILWHLLKEGPLAAKDIASKLGVSLPTALEHLETLVASGLVSVEEGVLSGKKYRATAECVKMVISIPNHARSDEDAVRGLARAYVARKLEEGSLRLPISVRDVARVLGIDRRTAAQVAGLLNNELSILEEAVEPLVLETLRNNGSMSISELSRKLGVDTGIITLAVTSLAQKGSLAFTPTGEVTIVKRG